MHDKARVAALQKAIEQERIEDIRLAERFRELTAKVRAFRDGKGKAPTEAELKEWAEHTEKAAAVAERLGELPNPPGNLSPASAVRPEFADSATLAAAGAPDSQRSPEVEWVETFAYAFLALGTETGKEAGDIVQLMGRAAGLWPQHGTRDAIEVAQQEFKKDSRG